MTEIIQETKIKIYYLLSSVGITGLLSLLCNHLFSSHSLPVQIGIQTFTASVVWVLFSMFFECCLDDEEPYECEALIGYIEIQEYYLNKSIKILSFIISCAVSTFLTVYFN